MDPATTQPHRLSMADLDALAPATGEAPTDPPADGPTDALVEPDRGALWFSAACVAGSLLLYTTVLLTRASS